jgi:ABC-type lipoprotein export system ATPase subunit
MPVADYVRSTEINRSARVMQLEGLFDVPPSQRSELTWHADLPIEGRPWNVGLIVGPSGCGKSTLAREMFGAQVVSGFNWPGDKSIVDAFPADMGIKDITMLLSSVGFSSPPSWVRPFSVLSTGEQFRVTVARAMAKARQDDLFVLDEFTSVVDRTVARIGSAAVAKTIRRRKQKFIAVTCHYDIVDWLQPDWTYDPSTGKFQWRELQRRPGINLTISRVHHSAWKVFSKHHYLTANLSHAATCFVAFIDGVPATFHSYLPFVGRLKTNQKAMRGHRSVCLPDFQGVGIGHALITYLAGMWKGLGYRVFRNTGHPAEIAAARRAPECQMIREPSRTSRDGGPLAHRMSRTRASTRITASFEFIGGGMKYADAYVCLNSWAKAAA